MSVTLQDAINAIQAGDLASGKALLARLLQQEPNNEAAWIWMSGTVEDTDQRRYCLEKALEINPGNATAQAGLLRLGFQPPNAIPPTPLARKDHGLGLPENKPEAAPSATPAFVWPEKDETGNDAPIVEETFIGDIVAAMNKDESSEQTPPDTDLNWLFAEEETGQTAEKTLREGLNDIEEEAAGEVSSSEATQAAGELPPTPAFTGLEADEIAALTAAARPSVGKMWRNPDERSRQLIIMTDRYLISARPDPKHLSEIEAMLETGQFPRRLLGHGAKMIPVERIASLQANENSAALTVNYQRNTDLRKQAFTLASEAQRDEVVEAFKTRQGAAFRAGVKTANLWDTLLVPGLTLLVIALITGLLYFWGMDLLINPQSLGRWVPEAWAAWLASDAAVNLPLYVVAAGGALMLLVMLWLVVNLRKPRRTLWLERVAE